jgi:hypothetical protein
VKAIREIVRAEQIAPFIKLPKELQGGEVEVIVLPFTPKRENISRSIKQDRKLSASANKGERKAKSGKNPSFSADSFGMWRDRTDMSNANQYIRDIRNERRFDY